MLLPKFDFHEPASIDEACEIMAAYGAKAKLLAGGTDLMVNMKKKILTPAHLVCLSRISTMHGIEEKGDQIVIGGRYTVAELTVDALVEKKLGALRSGAQALGSPLVRNRATIGGNIGSARPAADLPPSLIAYGATAMLESNRGKRELPLGDFFKGPGFTEIDVDEILTEVRVPVPRQGEGAVHLNPGPIDLRSLLQDMKALFSQQARAKGLPPEYPRMEYLLISRASVSSSTSEGQSVRLLPGFDSESSYPGLFMAINLRFRSSASSFPLNSRTSLWDPGNPWKYRRGKPSADPYSI